MALNEDTGLLANFVVLLHLLCTLLCSRQIGCDVCLFPSAYEVLYVS